eukprot:TRINITY_DN2606_c0_g3_i4.p1 TRINITY_DN2606_c0_g3~~TRINITY_DN2606_c0_g3_i4.p1  ORF type:complete len:186 (-),score=9.83 TRINITY_DN2606_c0_g3_i4:88-645(-)
MYSACTYDVSVFNITDQWCSLFTKEDFYNFEYYSDLSNYYVKGYGIPLSYQIGCSLIQEFVDIFDSVINGSQLIQKAKFRFAHAETLLPFLSLLGLFRDPEPLRHDSDPNFINNRLWKTSVIASYASNIKLILYSCPDRYRVKAVHNEVEYLIPGCDDLYCTYSVFKSTMAPVLALNFDRLCNIN